MAYHYDSSDESRGYRVFSWCADTCGEGAELLEEMADRMGRTPIVGLAMIFVLAAILFPFGLLVRAYDGYQFLLRKVWWDA